MDGKLKIKIAAGLLLLSALVASFLVPVAVQAEELLEVPLDKQPKDEKVLEELQRRGIDERYVEIEKDYGLRSEGKSPYSVTYKDLKSATNIMLVSGLPHADAFGDKINPSLFNWEGKYYSNSADNFYNNLFWLEVGGTQATAMARRLFGIPNCFWTAWSSFLRVRMLCYFLSTL